MAVCFCTDKSLPRKTFGDFCLDFFVFKQQKRFCVFLVQVSSFERCQVQLFIFRFFVFKPQKRFRVAFSFCVRTSLCLERRQVLFALFFSVFRPPPAPSPQPPAPSPQPPAPPKSAFVWLSHFVCGQAFAWKDVRFFLLHFFSVFKPPRAFPCGFPLFVRTCLAGQLARKRFRWV